MHIVCQPQLHYRHYHSFQNNIVLLSLGKTLQELWLLGSSYFICHCLCGSKNGTGETHNSEFVLVYEGEKADMVRLMVQIK